MGREQAAIALAVVSTKDPAHFRTTPGGYFHGMVAKAKAGELNLDRTLWAVNPIPATPPPLRSVPASGKSGRTIQRGRLAVNLQPAQELAGLAAPGRNHCLPRRRPDHHADFTRFETVPGPHHSLGRFLP
jgi:hypothetical protein